MLMLRSLLATVAAVSILAGIGISVYRWHVFAQEERALRDLSPYAGVYSMASALNAHRTGGQSNGYMILGYFMNHVEAVDLSPHNWAAKERRGKTLAVDDEALAMLCKFRDLRTLNLRNTRVTDEGLRHINALKRLERLDISGTQISGDGLQQLQAALPNCEISR